MGDDDDNAGFPGLLTRLGSPGFCCGRQCVTCPLPKARADAMHDTMPEDLTRPRRRWAARLGMAAGLVLLIIGLRFLAWPEAATRSFGLGRTPSPQALDVVIGLRDIWLGGLAVAFALLREWRALALWLLLGAIVCLGDAVIVAVHGGPWAALAFHVGSGVFCAVLGWRCRRIAAASSGPST